MDDWVREDLTGPGARRRNLIRVGIPPVLVAAPFWFLPASLTLHLILSGFVLLPFVYFAHALDKVWRTHRLRQHGLDADLVDERTRLRDAHIREDYERRHGRGTP